MNAVTEQDEFETLNDIMQECGWDLFGEALRKRFQQLSKLYRPATDSGMFYCPYIPLQFAEVKMTFTN